MKPWTRTSTASSASTAFATLTTVGLLALAPNAAAQTFPTKPMTMAQPDGSCKKEAAAGAAMVKPVNPVAQ